MIELGSGRYNWVFQGKSIKYVRKFPKVDQKPSCEYEVMKKSLEIHKVLFWKFNPRTRINRTKNWYWVVQKRVKWETLQEINANWGTLNRGQLTQLLEFLKMLEQALLQWYTVDYLGHQERDLEKPTYTKNKVRNFILKILHLKAFWNYNKNIFNSSNIMAEDWWDIFFVDNLDTIKEDKSLMSSHWRIMKLLIIQYYKVIVRYRISEKI